MKISSTLLKEALEEMLEAWDFNLYLRKCLGLEDKARGGDEKV